MSVHYLSACWKLEGLTSTQKFVLVSLADQANDEGVCWPSIGSIAQRTCLTERAVQLAMRELIALNLVQKDERVNRSSVFTVTPERHSGEPRSPVNHIHQGGESYSPGGEPRSPEGRTTFTQNRNRTVNEPPKNQSLSSDDDGQEKAVAKQKAERIPFDEIFELYEKHCCAHPFNRPRVLLRDDKRKALIKKVWSLSARTKTMEFWDEYFELATQNAHWMYGDKSKGGTWPGANFDFLLKADRVKAIVEGNV